MTDRDIPSVPVTTLAGLTSLSDLLSELPISDPLSIQASLNKTLLFHPRVAEEAHNILAEGDQLLIQQLVQAIEQTNSHEIELKEEYPELKDEYKEVLGGPQLLQAIYNYKPNVFSNPSKRVHETTTIRPQYLRQQIPPTQQQPSQIQQNPSIIQQNLQYNVMQEKPQYIHQQYHLQPIIIQQDQQHFIHEQHLFLEQQQNTLIHHNNEINNLNISNQTGIGNNQTNLNWNNQTSSIVNQGIVSTPGPPSVIQQNQQQANNQRQQNVINTTGNFVPQQQVVVQQNNQNVSSHAHHQPQKQNIQIPVHYQQNATQVIQQTVSSGYEQLQTIPINELPQESSIIQNFQVNHQNQQQQTSHLHNNSSQNSQQVPNASPIVVNNNQNAVGNGGNVLDTQQNSNLAQKVAPRNIEYLEKQQQNKNFDIRGPSPAQANDAIDNAQIALINSNSNNAITKTAMELQQKDVKHSVRNCDPNNKNDSAVTEDVTVPVDQPEHLSDSMTENANADLNAEDATSKSKILKVAVAKLREGDIELLKESVDTFKEKRPNLAKKLGLIEDETTIFERMKAEETNSSSILGKRKIQEDLPFEKMFSKPKLRKIERKILKAPTKLTKDEIIKSNTYQRFMSTMEQILEQLYDTETLNLNEENYENIDCIPNNLLMSISAEAAKLKAKGNAIEILPQNKLTLLISYAMRSIHIAKNISAGPDMGEDLVAEDAFDKILSAVEAALLICNIYSCRNTSSLQEDNVDTIIKFLQFQLRETIFPSYDSVYTVETKKKNKTKNNKMQQQREITKFYSKVLELTKILVVLMQKFQFEDTIIIHASALGIEPFFVDNIETLQFVCLDLVISIFQNDKYRKHRHNILTEILSSIDRLSSSKRNLRPYKLTNNAGNIQMITALVLQLVQCSVLLPETLYEDAGKNKNKKSSTQNNDQNKNTATNKIDTDLYIREKYQQAINIGGNFLSSFLQKCRSRSGENDFRPIFENFIDDLLTTVNKPEWPAAELLLSLLGTLLVNSMSDKTKDQTVRVTSLEYLGLVASRLRKDTVVSRCKVNTMDQLIKLIKIEQEKEGDTDAENATIQIDPEEERLEFLQRILLDFLAVNAQEENIIWSHSRHFYLTQWYNDILLNKKKIGEGEKGYASRKKQPKKKRRHKNGSESETSDDDSSDEGDEKKTKAVDQELNLEIYRILDKRKTYLLSKISPYSDNSKVHDIKTYIDYGNAQLIAQYLASKRLFSQSFDKYLQKIILVVREQSIAIRTKAMKCLASIVEVDPSILSRKDMQMGVNQKFLDTSISVREAAVDLVGKYVLSSPDLIKQYYDMLSKRILDTGVSVRKRVIKILRDICMGYPDFDKIPEICVKMIRRVNDEEGIQKLVTDVFLNMWFTPCKENDKIAIKRKIFQIIDVVNSSHDTGMQWLDGLLKTIFQSKESKDDATVRKEPSKQLIQACQQIVDGLVNALMMLEEDNDSKKLLGCVTTLNLFAKIRPQLLVQHAITLEPYLNIKCSSNDITRFISIVAEILEEVVPLMEHPGETFLSDLESHLMMLIVVHNQTVLLTCIACLAAVVNKITKNYKLIRDCFSKYYKTLVCGKQKLLVDENYIQTKQAMIRRSMYIIGLFMRYFNFNDPEVYGEGSTSGVVFSASICDEVFHTLMTYITCTNMDIRKETLKSLGFFCITNYEYLTKPELRDFYHDLLALDTVGGDMKTIVLRNISTYLLEEDQKHLRNEKEWVKKSASDDLKEMGDVSSGMSSRIIQLYLKDILNCFLKREYNVRLWAMKVADVVLKQGLVHPVQIVPYLICLSTDSSKEIAHYADFHLQDIDRNHSGFINMKTYAGIHLSFELQTTLQLGGTNNIKIVRGYRINSKEEPPSSLNGFLYSLLRNTKPQRRALIQSITKQFDDQRTSLRQMLYLADNLAYFPYLVQDEPLYIIHQIDVLISVTGTNLLSNFRDGLKPLLNPVGDNQQNPLDEDDDDDPDALCARLPEDTSDLENCIRAAQGCMLLLILKQHLKDCYGLTDGKISQYSPSEAGKTYEKQMQRRSVPIFKPQATILVIEEEENAKTCLDADKKRDLIIRYLDFKQLMLKLDPEDPDAEEDENSTKPKPTDKIDNSLNITVNPGEIISTDKPDLQKIENSSAHVNNVNNTMTPALPPQPQTPVQQHANKKDFTPTVVRSTRNQQKTTSVIKSSSAKKSDSSTKKRRRRRLYSSASDESDSDPDYE